MPARIDPFHVELRSQPVQQLLAPLVQHAVALRVTDSPVGFRGRLPPAVTPVLVHAIHDMQRRSFPDPSLLWLSACPLCARLDGRGGEFTVTHGECRTRADLHHRREALCRPRPSKLVISYDAKSNGKDTTSLVFAIRENVRGTHGIWVGKWPARFSISGLTPTCNLPKADHDAIPAVQRGSCHRLLPHDLPHARPRQRAHRRTVGIRRRERDSYVRSETASYVNGHPHDVGDFHDIGASPHIARHEDLPTETRHGRTTAPSPHPQATEHRNNRTICS